MPGNNLARRLGRIRGLAGRKPESPKENAPEPDIRRYPFDRAPVPGTLPGWERVSPYVFERSSRVHPAPFREELSPHLPLLFPREKSSLAGLLRSASLPGSLVFFDLETTGLSRGAGTVAFMASVGRFAPSASLPVTDKPGTELEIRQLLLADYPGESEFLGRFASLVGDSPALVSFNGKCFDSQILSSRFLLNGMQPAFLSAQTIHLDLLFPARRLWKERLGDCSLQRIEAGILGRQRIDDLPGSEAPDAWFEYLRGASPARLLAVGDHNRADCASLCEILFALDAGIEAGEGRAGLLRALDLRSRRDYAGAARFLEPLAAAVDTGAARDTASSTARIAARLLAIDSEHRLGNIEGALSLSRMIGDERRTARLEEKAARLKEIPLE